MIKFKCLLQNKVIKLVIALGGEKTHPCYAGADGCIVIGLSVCHCSFNQIWINHGKLVGACAIDLFF